jgi:hypothetical protein
VAIEAYSPWSDRRRDSGRDAFSAQEDYRTVFGEHINSQRTKPPLRNFLLQTDRLGAAAADYGDPQTMRETLLKEGHAKQPGSGSPGREASRFAALSFDSGQNSSKASGAAGEGDSAYSVGFVAMIGDDFGAMQAESNNLLQRLSAGILDQEEKKYENSRVKSGGALGESLGILSRMLNWSRVYLPEKQLEYAALGRRNDRDTRNAPLGWDSFFNAVVSSLVGDGSAQANVRLLLEGLSPDGRAPLRRYLQTPRRGEAIATAGRSMPPIGALCVWKVYLVTRDLELLASAYPRLRQWNEWWFADRGDGQPWRDGNGDGLLEWGFDAELEQGQLGARTMSNAAKQLQAFSESGLEERPQWLNSATGSDQPGAQPSSSVKEGDEARFNDKTHTLEYSTVGLNALYALDTEMMMMMANELGLSNEAGKWRARYDQIKKNVNEKLWSEEDGLYLNRHWDGRFSRRLSPENFYPLAAGLADEEKVKRMMTTLLDPKKFWGDYPLPSISRDDSAFSGNTPGHGDVWAPMNYLIYLGLKRHDYHKEAAELSRKSLAIERPILETSGKSYDRFSSVDGRPVIERSDEDGAAPRPYFFGLIVWPGVEEALNADPWTGMSFGSLAATEESRLERLNLSGVKVDVIAGPERTIIRRDGATEVECETPVRLRAYQSSDRAIAFVIEAKERAHIAIPASKGRKVTVSVDDKVLGSTSPGAMATFKVSHGIHKVLAVK